MEKYSELEMIDHMKKLFLFADLLLEMELDPHWNISRIIIKSIRELLLKLAKKVFDWEIPNEWNINDAFIEHIESGERYAEFRKNNLHLVGYSEPVDKEIEFDELSKKIFTLKDQPDLIPYITSYYKRNWGFCMSENNKKKMKKVNIKYLLIQN